MDLFADAEDGYEPVAEGVNADPSSGVHLARRALPVAMSPWLPPQARLVEPPSEELGNGPNLLLCGCQEVLLCAAAAATEVMDAGELHHGVLENLLIELQCAHRERLVGSKVDDLMPEANRILDAVAQRLNESRVREGRVNGNEAALCILDRQHRRRGARWCGCTHLGMTAAAACALAVHLDAEHTVDELGLRQLHNPLAPQPIDAPLLLILLQSCRKASGRERHPTMEATRPPTPRGPSVAFARRNPCACSRRVLLPGRLEVAIVDRVATLASARSLGVGVRRVALGMVSQAAWGSRPPRHGEGRPQTNEVNSFPPRAEAPPGQNQYGTALGHFQSPSGRTRARHSSSPPPERKGKPSSVVTAVSSMKTFIEPVGVTTELHSL